MWPSAGTQGPDSLPVCGSPPVQPPCSARIRERLIKARTALVNEIRGLLSEYGAILPQSLTKFRALIVDMLQEGQAKLTPLCTELFRQLYDEFRALEKRLGYYDEQLAALGQVHPECQRLQTIPGIGSVSATALIAPIGDATTFKNCRQLAAWLGLVPREHSTGGKPGLQGVMAMLSQSIRLCATPQRGDGWSGDRRDAKSRWPTCSAMMARPQGRRRFPRPFPLDRAYQWAAADCLTAEAYPYLTRCPNRWAASRRCRTRTATSGSTRFRGF